MSMIKNLFPDNLLATTGLDPATLPGLNNMALMGPNRFDGLDLNMVADSIDTSGNGTEKADQARPTVLASTSSFVTSVHHYTSLTSDKLTDAEMKAPGYQDYLEWQGLVAALALRNIYSVKGLDLSIQTVSLSAQKVEDDCVLLSMAKDDVYKYAVQYNQFGQPQSGVIFYICQKGVPFAMFHPEIGLCPKKEYDSSIFDGILDWYDTSTGWKDLLDPNKPKSMKLDEFYLSRLAWWLKENGMTNAYAKCVGQLSRYNHAFYTRLADAPLTGAAVIDKVANKMPEDNIAGVPVAGVLQAKINALWGKKGSTVLTASMAYSYNGRNLPLPKLYTEKLFLAAVSNDTPSELIYNVTNGANTAALKIGFVSNGGYPALDRFCPVAPFTKLGAEVLATQCKLTGLKFVPVAENDGLISVDVKTSIQTPDGEVVTIDRRYPSSQIKQGTLPYVMVWPCVPLPEDSWHQYYATCESPRYTLGDIFIKDQNTQKPIKLVNSGLLRVEMNAGSSNTINRATATGENKWTVWYNDKPFDYAVLSCLKQPNSTDTETLGVFFVPYCRPIQKGDPTVVQVSTPTILAVDFGTTSTVVGLKINGGADQVLPYCDYSRTITVEDELAKRSVMQHHWLGTDEDRTGKIFSVAQLFDRADGTAGPSQTQLAQAGNNRYYVDGRMFVVSGALLQAYTNANGLNVFGSQKIINDMKFSAMANPLNMHAASIFLAGIYQYAMLYLLKQGYYPVQGTDYVTLYSSYPNAVTRSSLEQSWMYAQRILSSTLSRQLLTPLDPGKINYRTEAQATTVYNSQPGVAVHFPHMISVDIGGGTTDIAIKNLRNSQMGASNSGDVRQLSIRYAGRELMVESLVEAYRRFADEGKTPALKNARNTAFKNLWPAQNAQNLVTSFDSICNSAKNTVAQQDLVRNDSLRMVVECLLAGGMDIGAPTLKPEHKTLRQVITLKFAVLMLTVAQIIARNMDIWNDGNGKLYAPGNILALDMVMSGTSAQLLQYVFNCDLSQLNNMDIRSVRLPQVKWGINIINQFIEKAIETVLGDRAAKVLGQKGSPNRIHVSFKFHVNPEVAQKREVSFGLLEMPGKPEDNDPQANTVPASRAVPGTASAAAMPMDDLFGDDLFGDVSTGTVGRAAAPAAAAAMDPDKEKQQRAERKQAASNAILNASYTDLQAFITGDLATFVRLFDSHVAPYATKSNIEPLKKNGVAASDLPSMLADFNPTEFTSEAMATKGRHAEYMCEEEQQPYLDVLARLYLVDELLNYQMAKYQG